MDYNNRNVRRQDRLLEEENAIMLLRKGEYGILSLQGEKGGAYGVPVNYVWDNRNSIYIHCAPEGRKLQCIVLCPQVSFCVVGKTRVIADKFTTAYESIILHGEARIRLVPEERRQALSLLLSKYSPHDKITGLQYAEKSLYRTEIIRLDITEWSGKCKRVK